MNPTVNGPTLAVMAAAAALGLNMAGPHRAYAAPINLPEQSQNASGPAVTVLSPAPRSTFSGLSPVEVSAFYQGTSANPIVSLELYVDGNLAAAKKLDVPEARGVVSFLIDASLLSGGTHRIVVRAASSDAEIVSAKSSFVFSVPSASPAQPAVTAEPAANTVPEISFTGPARNETVSGTVRITLNATDASGKAPYVSVFVDKVFKTLKNYPPYDYEWDTTGYTNGVHTIEAMGYNEAQNVSKTKVLQLNVNNPGGRTELRTDLKDGGSAPQAKTAKPRRMAAKPHTSAAKRRVTSAGAPLVSDARAHSMLRESAGPQVAMQASQSIHTAPWNTTPDLSDPFIPTQPAPRRHTAVATRHKALAAHKPAPRGEALLADAPVRAKSRTSRDAQMAKRIDLRTAPWNQTPDLSDPFIPAETTVKAHATATKRARLKPTAPRTVATAATPVKHVAAEVAPVRAVAAAPVHHAAPVHVVLAAPVHHASAKSTSAQHVVAEVAAVQSRIAAVTPPLNAASPVRSHHHTANNQHLVRIADGRMPSSGLASPYLAAPHIQALPVTTHKRIASVRSAHASGAHYRKFGIHTAVSPATTSLLRSKGQTMVIFDNKPVHLDRPLASKGSIMFGPLRPLFEFEGGSLEWKQSTNTVTAQSQHGTMQLTIGHRTAQVNNEKVVLKRAPYLSGGRTMVPIALLSTVLDADIQYDAASGHLLVTSKK